MLKTGVSYLKYYCEMLGRRVNLKKLLVFSQFFYPDQTGTGKVLAELFSYLARKGFAVTALSSRQIHNDSKNTILAAHEVWEKVEIHRVFKTKPFSIK